MNSKFRFFIAHESGAVLFCTAIFLFLLFFDAQFEIGRALKLSISLFLIYQFVLFISWLLDRYRHP